MNLRDYIQGKRHGKKANKLEREAMQDPFLQDAMDGFDMVDDNHMEAIDFLEKQLESRTNKKKTKHLNNFRFVGIAASIVIILGIGTVVLLTNTPKNDAPITATIPEIKEPSVILDTTHETTIPKQDIISLSKEKDTQDRPSSTPPKEVTPIPAEESTLSSSKDDVPIESGEEAKTLKMPDITYASAQKAGDIATKSIRGTLKDDAGEPIIGATVMVKGTNIGTVTDFDGNYHLINVPDSSIIQFSYVGMQPQELVAQSVMNVRMKSEGIDVEDFVVTGYQKIDRKMFTGSAAVVKAEEAKVDSVNDVSRMLQGKAAGVQMENVSGTFGAAPRLRVRGNPSMLGSGQPLWVVDGVVIEAVEDISADNLSSDSARTFVSSVIAGLKAEDIEDFKILKDSSATALYGARAANGVIVITTKKGTLPDKKEYFGKKQFIRYWEENRRHDTCGEKSDLILEFYINAQHRPENIEVIQGVCKEVEVEVIELLEKGPDWTTTEESFKLKIKLK